MRQDRVYERSSCTAYVWASHSSKYCSRNATQMKASKLVPSSYRRVIGSPPVPSLPVPLAPPPHAGTSRSATSCLSLQLVLMEIRGCVSQSCAPLRARQICSSILAAPTGTEGPCQFPWLPGLEPGCRSPSVPRPPPFTPTPRPPHPSHQAPSYATRKK